MRELPVENVNTEEEMDFDDLNIPGDYSDYDILGKGTENTSNDDEDWVKTKMNIYRGRAMLIPYSHKEEVSEHLKIKWIDSRKEKRVLIKDVPLDYSKKIVSVPTQQYYNVSYMEETVHSITTETIQRKIYDIY